MKPVLRYLFAFILILSLCGCGVATEPTTEPAGGTAKETTVLSAVTDEKPLTVYVSVMDDKGDTTLLTVNTDKQNLGEALLEQGLIAGEQGAYGLYVKTVNGIYADYDVNGAYWALSQDGQALMTGVDGVTIENGAHYEFTYTK